MALDAYDTHLCLVCNMTIFGLENYVSHRRSACSMPKPGHGRTPPGAETKKTGIEHSVTNLPDTHQTEAHIDVSALHSIAEQVGSNS